MSVILDLIVKPSLLVAVALLASLALRRRSAATRHWVLATGLFCGALSPLASAVVPAWRIEVPARSAPRVPWTPVSSATQTSGSGDDAVQVAVSVATPPLSSDVSPEVWMRRVWLSGAVFGIGLLAAGRWRLARLAAKSTVIESGAWFDIAHETSRQYGLRRRVRLLYSPHPTLLVTWGAVAPTICIPSATARWSAERIRVVLGHELAHIRRNDWIVQVFAETLRSLYWFNPLMWLACTGIRHYSERACDDVVLRTGIAASAYGEHLFDLARALRGPGSWTPALGIVRPSSLERRFRAMLDEEVTRTPMTRVASATSAVVLVTLTLAVAQIQIGAQSFATLSGTVVDPQGRLLPVATIALVRGSNNARYEIDTDANGRYELVGLVPDDYTIEVRRLGFKTIRDTLNVGGSLTRDFTMDIGTLQETITVSGGPSSGPRQTATDVPSLEEFRRRFKETLATCDPIAQGAATGGRIRPPRKIRDVRPVYPEGLRAAGIGGTVQMDAVIGVDGRVKEMHPLEGQAVDPGLVAAAMEAVNQWEFDGTLLNCEPVEVSMTVSISFGPL